MSLHFSEKQLEAIRFPVSSPSILSIVAGPGCGKSEVLTHRVKNLIEQQNIRKEEILILTNHTTLVSKLKKLLQNQNILIDVRTFDSLAFEYVEKDAYKKQHQGITIWDNFSKLAIKAITNRSKFDLDYNGFRSQYIDDFDVEQPPDISKIFQKYLIVNYEEVQRRFLNLFKNEPYILLDKYKVIIIDEFQDIRNSFYEFVLCLTEMRQLDFKHKLHLTIAGDPNQSIYNFLQQLDIYKNFRNKKKSVDMHEILLNQTFQTSKGLVKFFNEYSDMQLVAPDNKIDKRDSKFSNFMVVKNSFCDNLSIYDYICREIKTYVSKIYNFEDILVLGYSNDSISKFKQAADFYRIPVNNHGFKKGQYDGIKKTIENGFLNFLKILSNPEKNDLALISCMMLINGIQIRTVHSLIKDYIADENHETCTSLWNYICSNHSTYKSTKKLSKFIQILIEVRQFYSENPESANNPEIIFKSILSLINDAECSKKLLNISHNQKDKTQSVLLDFYRKFLTLNSTRLQKIQNGSMKINLLEWVIENYWFEELKFKDCGSINVSTIHSAKGLQHKAVFLIEAPLNYESLKINSKSELFNFSDYKTNERRLFYTAITRAQSLLYLCPNHLQFTTKNNLIYTLNPEKTVLPGSVGSLSDLEGLKSIFKNYNVEGFAIKLLKGVSK